jgi:hypothetical protein
LERYKITVVTQQKAGIIITLLLLILLLLLNIFALGGFNNIVFPHDLTADQDLPLLKNYYFLAPWKKLKNNF